MSPSASRSPSASASPSPDPGDQGVSISSFRIPYYQRPGETAYIRIFFTKPFEDIDLNYIPGGGSPRHSTFYKRLTCAVNKFTHIVTVPQFGIPVTTTASDPSARVIFSLYDNSGAFVRYLSHKNGAYWIIPNTVTNWADLVQYNETH